MAQGEQPADAQEATPSEPKPEGQDGGENPPDSGAGSPKSESGPDLSAAYAKADIREAILWVAHSLGKLTYEVLKKNAPNTLTWGLWQWAITNEKTRQEFWGKLFTKLLPKDVPSEGARRESSGAAIQEHIAKLQAISQKARGSDG